MSLQPTKTQVVVGMPIFQHILETAQGGFLLDTTGLTIGSTLKGGTALTYDETTRIAKVANVDGSDAKGLLFADTVIGDDEFATVVIRGTVYENRIPEVADEVKAAIPLIVFSKSF